MCPLHVAYINMLQIIQQLSPQNKVGRCSPPIAHLAAISTGSIVPFATKQKSPSVHGRATCVHGNILTLCYAVSPYYVSVIVASLSMTARGERSKE